MLPDLNGPSKIITKGKGYEAEILYLIKHMVLKQLDINFVVTNLNIINV